MFLPNPPLSSSFSWKVHTHVEVWRMANDANISPPTIPPMQCPGYKRCPWFADDGMCFSGPFSHSSRCFGMKMLFSIGYEGSKYATHDSSGHTKASLPEPQVRVEGWGGWRRWWSHFICISHLDSIYCLLVIMMLSFSLSRLIASLPLFTSMAKFPTHHAESEKPPNSHLPLFFHRTYIIAQTTPSW